MIETVESLFDIYDNEQLRQWDASATLTGTPCMKFY
jgi:hypothetical protein